MQDIAVKLDALRSRRYENLSSSIVWCQQPLPSLVLMGGGGGGGGVARKATGSHLIKTMGHWGSTVYWCYIIFVLYIIKTPTELLCGVIRTAQTGWGWPKGGI